MRHQVNFPGVGAFLTVLIFSCLVLMAVSVKKVSESKASLTGGAIPLATCVIGSIHVDTDESVDTFCTTTADNSICLCIATDTWITLENPTG